MKQMLSEHLPAGAGMSVGLSAVTVRLRSGRRVQRLGAALLHPPGAQSAARALVQTCGLSEEQVRLVECKALEPEASRIRPIYPGLSISHSDGLPGTLSALVRHRGEAMLLASSHVVALSGRAKAGDKVYQPGRSEHPSASPVGTLVSSHPLHASGRNLVDAALVSVSVGRNPRQGKKIKVRHGFHGDPAELLNIRVKKYGRSGLTRGVITVVEADGHKIRYSDLPGKPFLTFDDILLIKGQGGRFTKPGDSGALVWTDDKRLGGTPMAVAHHIAGKGSLSAGARWSHVEALLGCRLL